MKEKFNLTDEDFKEYSMDTGFDEVNSSYGTKEIDYSRVIIQVTDVTNIDSTFVVSKESKLMNFKLVHPKNILSIEFTFFVFMLFILIL